MIPTFSHLEGAFHPERKELDKKALPSPEVNVSEYVASKQVEEELLVEVLD
jgi:hypothetical protein